MFDEVESVILSALFVSKSPLDIEDLYKEINNIYIKNKKMKKISKDGVMRIIENINDKLSQYNLPFEVKRFPSEKYDLVIKERYFKYVENLAPHKEFSRATLQTLALIAYKSPIKQKDVVKIRGQRAPQHIKELIEKGFVKAEKVKNYKVLRITKKFLDYFGLRNEEELRKFFAEREIKEEEFGRV